MRCVLPVLLLLWAAPLHAEPPRNLVRNSGFEAVAGELPIDWNIHEDVEESSRGKTSRDTTVFRNGAASLHLALPPGGADVQAVIQTTELLGPLAALAGTSVLLSAWVRAQDVAFCHVWIEFLDGHDDEISIHNLNPTRPIYGTSDWAEYGRALTIPEATHKIAVGVSLYYSGDVWVDDLAAWTGMSEAAVTAALARTAPPKPEAGTAVVSEVQGSCTATATRAAADGEAVVILSAPIPFEGQAPLGFRIGSIPPDRIHAVTIVKLPYQDQIEVSLKALPPGETVRLFWQSLTLATDRPLDPGALTRARIGPREPGLFTPGDWLRAEPGIELDVPIVQGMAERLKSYQGFYLDFLQGLHAAVDDRLNYREGGPQGADAVLTRKYAGPTGYANALAAIARAGNVPARLLACAPEEASATEDFLVEFHGEEVGWVRSHPVHGAFPWSDAAQVVLRVIYPTEARTPDQVPVPIQWRGPIRAGLLQGALRRAAALRLEGIEQAWRPFADTTPILVAARTAWDEYRVPGSLGAEVRFLTTAKLPPELRTRLAGSVLADPDAFLALAFQRHATFLDSLSMGWGLSLVRNPGFEEENRGRPSGWHLPSERSNYSDITVAGGTCLRGQRALKAVLKGTRNRYEVVTQRVTRFPMGLPLALSVYLRGQCDGDAVLTVTYLDDARNPIRFVDALTARTRVQTPTEWRRLSLDLDAPRGAATIEIQLATDGPGELWVDEFDLRAGGGFPAWPGEELLVNPGFEDGGNDGLPSGWKAVRPPVPPDDLDLAQEVKGRDTKWAGYLSARRDDTPWHGFTQLVRHVPETHRVRLTGWIYTESATGVAALALSFRQTPFDEDQEPGEPVSTETSQPVKSTTPWTQVTLEADVPPGTLSIQVKVGAAGAGKVWFDDLSLQAVKGQ